ncbi:Crp/Fnr family transcriptional regulator [Candidatus Magnetomonas plexicatena]|uniref:Crp/Fnr family transcriptional regulator n=1 Tax=Candidatus Magnetomonas plexicatena TaxID=2552947 RepID=UPI0010FFD337|nr:Crp/Fnr family transcriptional regulator [Nitrospirales bacterium LBB_01]
MVKGEGTKKKQKAHSSCNIDQLRQLPCLSQVSDDDLENIGRKSFVKKYCKNDFVFLASDEVKFFFIVESGAVKLYKNSEEGREIVIQIMGMGEHFCCAPIYADNKQMVNAVAVEDTIVLAIPVSDFTAMLHCGLTDFGVKILRTLCMRVKHLSSIVENITFKDVEMRVLMAIMSSAERKSPDAEMVPLTLTHQELAAMTGTVREVVSRTMSKLRRCGVLSHGNQREFILNKQAAVEYLKQPH